MEPSWESVMGKYPELLNSQIQKNNNCTIVCLKTLKLTFKNLESQPMLATLLVEDGLELTKEEFIEYWRMVMTPWGVPYANKAWLTKEHGFEMEDAAKLEKMFGKKKAVVNEDDEYLKKPKQRQVKSSKKREASGKNIKAAEKAAKARKFF